MTSLQKKLAGTDTAETAPKSIVDWLKQERDHIGQALPAGMDADRFTRIVLTQVRQNQRLAACGVGSMLAATMLAAQLGLEPGPLGECYLSPRYVKGNLEVQFTLGYKGIIKLVWQSAGITSIEARAVYEHDRFDFAYGLADELVHRPTLTDRGDAVAFYGLARFVGGGHFFLVMSKADIDRHRALSDAGDSTYGPWTNHYDAMARKTVIRQMAPYMPLSTASAAGIAQDETVHTAIEADMTVITPEFVDTTGEETAGEETEPADAQ